MKDKRREKLKRANNANRNINSENKSTKKASEAEVDKAIEFLKFLGKCAVNEKKNAPADVDFNEWFLNQLVMGNLCEEKTEFEIIDFILKNSLNFIEGDLQDLALKENKTEEDQKDIETLADILLHMKALTSIHNKYKGFKEEYEKNGNTIKLSPNQLCSIACGTLLMVPVGDNLVELKWLE